MGYKYDTYHELLTYYGGHLRVTSESRFWGTQLIPTLTIVNEDLCPSVR